MARPVLLASETNTLPNPQHAGVVVVRSSEAGVRRRCPMRKAWVLDYTLVLDAGSVVEETTALADCRRRGC